MNEKSYEEIVDWLRDHLGQFLNLKSEEIDIAIKFTHYGLTSTIALMLAGDLEDWLGYPVRASLAYDYPSIEKLAKHLAGNNSN